MEVFLFIIAVFLYFIPSFVGYNKRNAGAIIALNFFLGWTLVGWVVALVWALTEDGEPLQVKRSPDNIDKIDRLKQLLDSGAITESEYQSEKQKLLQ